MKRLFVIISLILSLTVSVPYHAFAEKIIPPSPPCAESIGNQGCTSTETAIGVIRTEPEAVVMQLFTFLLSISGGIAVLSLILSGYKYMTSQGNPETVKGAHEMIFSTIAGMLFIILSFTLLQVIGIDLLHLPGFSQ